MSEKKYLETFDRLLETREEIGRLKYKITEQEFEKHQLHQEIFKAHDRERSVRGSDKPCACKHCVAYLREYVERERKENNEQE